MPMARCGVQFSWDCMLECISNDPECKECPLLKKETKRNKVMKANKVPETYPMQFRDKIDEYLWKEHHILGGCCSSIEEMKYSVAREVAEKLTDTFIEKACSYLDENCRKFILTAKDIDDFKKYMEGK